MPAAVLSALALGFFPPSVRAQQRHADVKISYPSPAICCLPVFAADKLKVFEKNGLQAAIEQMKSRVANPALLSGDIGYVAGVGPNSVSGTLRGMPTRAVWFASNQLAYEVLAKPGIHSVKDLRGKKIGLTAVGGTSEVALTLALQAVGEKRGDFTFIPMGTQLFGALTAGAVPAAQLEAPWIFYAQRKGFHVILNVGAHVKMPIGGLTTLVATIRNKPGQVKRVILSLQEAKDTMLGSEQKGVQVISEFLKVNHATAVETYRLYKKTVSGNGVPTREGMAQIVEALHIMKRLKARKVAFDRIADAHIAREVARQLGYKVN